MNNNIPSLRYELGNGHCMEVFSLDPSINSDGIISKLKESKVNFKESPAPPVEVIKKHHVQSLLDLSFVNSYRSYDVPDSLKLYRKALEVKLDGEGKHNGPVMLVTGELVNPIETSKGGYYDYMATRVDERPGLLLPDNYDSRKTVEDILTEEGIPLNRRARFLGMMHLIRLNRGKEIMFVHRAKGMGIASDCISTSGSTPDLVLDREGLKKRGFGIKEYWSYHIAEEMTDEFNLQWGDFWAEDVTLFDDPRTIPFGAVNIYTPLSASEIANRAYGNSRVLKEHNMIYVMNQETIPAFLDRFAVFPPAAATFRELFKE